MAAATTLNFGQFCIFIVIKVFCLTVRHNIATKFGDDWPNSKEMKQLFEIQDDGSRNFEKNTFSWTAITRNDF